MFYYYIQICRKKTHQFAFAFFKKKINSGGKIPKNMISE